MPLVESINNKFVSKKIILRFEEVRDILASYGINVPIDAKLKVTYQSGIRGVEMAGMANLGEIFFQYTILQ